MGSTTLNATSAIGGITSPCTGAVPAVLSEWIITSHGPVMAIGDVTERANNQQKRWVYRLRQRLQWPVFAPFLCNWSVSTSSVISHNVLLDRGQRRRSGDLESLKYS